MNQKSDTKNRPPIVTLMGHVDHGKTTLLDAIRKSNVIAGEHGGITQHIGAYQIIFQNKPITFIDTPGHAAFEKMRSRGAEVADVVILVVAASEGVKPQTQEAIKHIKAAKKPIILAITKTDLPNINVAKVKKELQKEKVVVEEFAGEVPIIEVAAPLGRGITELLEVIELLWQMNPQPSLVDESLEAVVIESSLDKNKGLVATLIIKKGKLAVGQKVTVDGESVTIRALFDENSQSLKEVLPGKPVQILGFKKVLEVGSIITDSISIKSKFAAQPATLSEIIAKSEEARGKFKIILKADVAGSLEAIKEHLPDNILIVNAGIGEISATDVSFAKVAQAPIVAFNIKVPKQVKLLAEREGVVIRSYNVIYDLISQMEEVASGFEKAKMERKISGRAKIIASFDIEGKKIIGAQVTSGKLRTNDKIILKNKDSQKGEAQIVSLKKYKKDVEAVFGGQECGIGLDPVLDFEIGDIIESFGSA